MEKNGSFAFAEGAALRVGAKANVPIARLSFFYFVGRLIVILFFFLRLHLTVKYTVPCVWFLQRADQGISYFMCFPRMTNIILLKEPQRIKIPYARIRNPKYSQATRWLD